MRIDVNDTVDDNLQLQEERDRNRKCVMQYKGKRKRGKKEERRKRRNCGEVRRETRRLHVE